MSLFDNFAEQIFWHETGHFNQLSSDSKFWHGEYTDSGVCAFGFIDSYLMDRDEPVNVSDVAHFSHIDCILEYTENCYDRFLLCLM